MPLPRGPRASSESFVRRFARARSKAWVVVSIGLDFFFLIFLGFFFFFFLGFFFFFCHFSSFFLEAGGLVPI